MTGVAGVTKPQKIVIRLYSSSQLYGAFDRMSAYCFGFMTPHNFSFTVVLIAASVFSEKGLINPHEQQADEVRDSLVGTAEQLKSQIFPS